MTVHKPIANLISVAVRYDAMHMYTNADNSQGDREVFDKEEYDEYKRRIGEKVKSSISISPVSCSLSAVC
jgi:hypothetical protein